MPRAGNATAVCVSPATLIAGSRSSAKRRPREVSASTCNLLSPKEAQALWPLMQVDDVVGAAFLPTDGQANPSDITQALPRARVWRGRGWSRMSRSSISSTENGVVKGVATNDGTIACEKVVLCCGLWTQHLAARAGATVPLAPVHHQYIVTERIDGVTGDLPTLRDPDRLTYYKEEVGGLVMGGYEPNPIPWRASSVPEDFAFRLLADDWDHFEPIMNLALGRVPALADAGVKQMINGLESFTPDGNWMIGEAPEARNLFRRRRLQRLWHRLGGRRRHGARRMGRRW